MAKPVGRVNKPTEREPRRVAWIVMLLALVGLTVLLVLGFRFLSTRALRTEIPQLPEFGRRSPAVQRQLTEADARARAAPRAPGALGRLGMAYHANAFHAQAETAYQLAARVEPQDHRWPYYLAVLALSTGYNERAVALLEQTLNLKPDHANAWARKGELLFRMGAYDEARKAFERAVKLAPHHTHATFGLARLAGLRDDWEEAARLLEDALAQNPHFGPAHDLLAVAYEYLGRVEDMRRHEGTGADSGFQMADPALDELWEMSSTGSILVMQATVAEMWGAPQRALRLLRRAVEVEPTDLDVRIALGRFLANPKYANDASRREAKTHYEAALKIDPGSLMARHEHAQMLDDLGLEAEARAQWERIVREDPLHAPAWMSLGQVDLRHQDYEGARESFRRGLSVPPDTPYNLGRPGMGYHRLGLACKQAGHPEEALAAFRRALDEDPHLTRACLDLARLLRELGRVEEGIAVYDQALAQDGGNAELRFGYGNFLVKLKRFEEAREQLRAALPYDLGNDRLLAALGYVELELGNVDRSARYLEQALGLAPNSVLAHYHLGNALLRQGRRAEARGHYERALQAQPNFQPARQALDALSAP